MSSGDKKISFSFSKVKKPALEIGLHKECKDKVEFVDCYDGAKGEFTYLGKGSNKDVHKKELVIPLIKSHRNIWSNLEDRKQLKLTNHADGIEGSSTNKSQDSIKTKSESQVSIDEIAALEILNDLKSDGQMKNSEKLVINQNMPLDSNFKENTIDYEQVPVSDFGMAMLRGMGWNPDSGIGKQPRLVPTVSPKLRPKGLGLGAKTNLKPSTPKKKLH